MNNGEHRARQSGITYLAILFFVAATSAMLAATGIIWSHERQRQKEEELLWIGGQFRDAIGLYYQRTPGTTKRYPEKIDDLIEDRRFLTTARYLRKIYRDPMTGQAQWGLIQGPDGGFVGVYSLSELRPIKTSNSGVSGAFGSATYTSWKFVYLPPAVPLK